MRSFDRSQRYVMMKKPGTYNARPGTTTSIQRLHKMRPCAVFEYRGDALAKEQAARLIGG